MHSKPPAKPSSEHVLVDKSHKPDGSPGRAQHWLLAVHPLIPIGMQAAQILSAQNEQLDGQSDESVQACPHASALTQTDAPWSFSLHMPEQQSLSLLQIMVESDMQHVPDGASGLEYWHTLPRQHLLEMLQLDKPHDGDAVETATGSRCFSRHRLRVRGWECWRAAASPRLPCSPSCCSA